MAAMAARVVVPVATLVAMAVQEEVVPAAILAALAVLADLAILVALANA